MLARLTCFAAWCGLQVIAYLVTQGFSLSDALALVQRQRPRACPNEGFMQQLRDFADAWQAGARKRAAVAASASPRTWAALPPRLLVRVGLLLDCSDRARCRSVSRAWRDAIPRSLLLK